MQYHTLILRFQVSNNYWKADHGKQKRTFSIHADAQNRSCYLRGRNGSEKLLACKAEKLLSNPCFEIWLLLHAKDQKTAITTDALIKELKKSAAIWKNYAKSEFTNTQETFLKSNTDTATARAKNLTELQNPSTGIYKLIELLKGR